MVQGGVRQAPKGPPAWDNPLRTHSRLFRDGFMMRSPNDAVVDFLLIHTQRGLLAVYLRNNRPQLFGTVTTAIATVTRHDLVRFGVTTRPCHGGVCLVVQAGMLMKNCSRYITARPIPT
jgi:hypothetical protein